MTNEKLLSLGLELLVLVILAGLYYLWQRHRILNGPRNWQTNKLVEVFHMALECDTPENFRDLEGFLSDTEKRVSSDTPWMNGEYIRRWKNAALPENITALLNDCAEWLDHSQPKTR